MDPSGIDPLLARLTRSAPTPAPVTTAAAWREAHRAGTADLGSPIARAMLGGFLADRPAWAFASGYHEALRSLRPSCGDAWVALAATEAKGNHPRAIEARLEEEGDGYRLSGHKRFVTLGPEADRILVIATRGEDAAGRPRLALAEVPRDRAGVRVTPMPELPFVPELPHGVLELQAVRLDRSEVDLADAYTTLLKPFRTVEDLFVAAALGAHALQVARRVRAGGPFLARHLALLACLHALGAADPSAAPTHVALEGALGLLHAQLDALPLSSAEPEVRARWQRDRALLDVASVPRAKRFERALAVLGAGGALTPPEEG